MQQFSSSRSQSRDGASNQLQPVKSTKVPGSIREPSSTEIPYTASALPCLNRGRGLPSHVVGVGRQCAQGRWQRGARFPGTEAADKTPEMDRGKSPRRHANHDFHNRSMKRTSYHSRHRDASWRSLRPSVGEYLSERHSGTCTGHRGPNEGARRMLPMVPAVYTALKARREAAGNPEEGWVFPASSREGHLNKDTAKDHTH